MAKGGFDYSQIEEYFKKLEEATAKAEFENFLKSFLLEMAQRVIAKAKPDTPVDTGALRNSYYIGSQKVALRNITSSDKKDAESQTVTRDLENSTIEDINIINNTLEVTIGNIMEYASYVEYGHAYPNGKWENGKFMFTIAINEIQQQIPDRFEKAFQEYLKNKGVN